MGTLRAQPARKEFDVRSWEIQPPFDGSDLPGRTLASTFGAMGKDPGIASRLPLVLRAAGATEPVGMRGNSRISVQSATELLGVRVGQWRAPDERGVVHHGVGAVRARLRDAFDPRRLLTPAPANARHTARPIPFVPPDTNVD